ncbi:hypothetical protein H1C71_000221 [Ictidomys tridecemlineatus]|nr:hypothetical protein H1C71_000221 [Ictidomys tridecemlineatus]
MAREGQAGLTVEPARLETPPNPDWVSGSQRVCGWGAVQTEASGVGTDSRQLSPRVAMSNHPGQVQEASQGQERGSRHQGVGPGQCFNRTGTGTLMTDCCH